MIALIGGSGVYSLEHMTTQVQNVETQWGEVAIQEGRIDGQAVAFLCRHGDGHALPPHRIPYRANIAALKAWGATRILATNAVGGIHPATAPGRFIVPHDLIDYTWGREHSFNDDFSDQLQHIEFTEPFDQGMRERLISTLNTLGLNPVTQAVYGCTQGPRFETAAEVRRLSRDGCDIVGMTAMPEAALAREAGMEYASLCFSVNWAAGLGDAPSQQEIMNLLKAMSSELQRGVSTLLSALAQ